MTPDQMAMMAALLRRQTGPLAWNQWDQSSGSNGGQQRSNVGMSNMMNPMAKALMQRGAGAPSAAATAASIEPIAAADTSSLYPLANISAASLEPAAASAAAAPAGAGAGAMAGGLAMGAVPMIALAMFSNYMDKHHTMTAQDYLKQWAGQSAKDKLLAAQLGAAGDVAGQKQYTALANTGQGLSDLTNSSLAGKYVPNVTTVRDPGYGRNAKPF